MNTDKFLSLGISLLIGASGYLWNKNTELEHRLTSLEVGHNKVEVAVKEHTTDPKLHHNIKEEVNAILTQVQLNTQRIEKLAEELDQHENHPKLHENILVEVEVLKKENEQLKSQIRELLKKL